MPVSLCCKVSSFVQCSSLLPLNIVVVCFLRESATLLPSQVPPGDFFPLPVFLFFFYDETAGFTTSPSRPPFFTGPKSTGVRVYFFPCPPRMTRLRVSVPTYVPRISPPPGSFSGFSSERQCTPRHIFFPLKGPPISGSTFFPRLYVRSHSPSCIALLQAPSPFVHVLCSATTFPSQGALTPPPPRIPLVSAALALSVPNFRSPRVISIRFPMWNFSWVE